MTSGCRLVPLSGHKVEDAQLSVLENGKGLPFPVKRIYILHGHDAACRRGFHAHKTLRQVMIAMSGAVRISIDDGQRTDHFTLTSPTSALIVEPVVWRELDMGKGAVLAVLASEIYDADDYIHDYAAFKKFVGQ